MFTRIGDVLPRFRLYERLFPSHERLVQALSVVYLDILTFCNDAKTVFRKAKRPAGTPLNPLPVDDPMTDDQGQW